MTMELWCDGACDHNPGGAGGWAAILVQPYHEWEFTGFEPVTTNNRMEITAAIKGLEQAPPGAKLTLISDSQYLVYTIQRNWQRRKNKDLWDLLDRQLARRQVRFQWVRGHNGNRFNERADDLAVRAMLLGRLNARTQAQAA